VTIKSICIAKASVELATAPQFDVIIKNYDLTGSLEEAYQLVRIMFLNRFH
jgi:guanylate kinase